MTPIQLLSYLSALKHEILLLQSEVTRGEGGGGGGKRQGENLQVTEIPYLLAAALKI